MPETMLDTRGLKCPLPVLRARKAMQGVAPGEVLRVLATDPAAARFPGVLRGDRPRAGGHTQQAGEFTFLLRKR